MESTKCWESMTQQHNTSIGSVRRNLPLQVAYRHLIRQLFANHCLPLPLRFPFEFIEMFLFFCGIFYCFLFPFQFFWHAISIELTVINKMSNLPHKLLRGEAFIRSGFTIRQENIRLWCLTIYSRSSHPKRIWINLSKSLIYNDFVFQ